MERTFFAISLKISTHALTWSATAGTVKIPVRDQDFNSRTHVECDIPDSMNGLPIGLFQLTHSRGVRPVVILINFGLSFISTHALTWSATSDRRLHERTI